VIVIMSKGQIWLQFDQNQHLKFKFGKKCAKSKIWGFEHSKFSGSNLGVKLSP
jgi:hypothetical protein